MCVCLVLCVCSGSTSIGPNGEARNDGNSDNGCNNNGDGSWRSNCSDQIAPGHSRGGLATKSIYVAASRAAQHTISAAASDDSVW